MLVAETCLYRANNYQGWDDNFWDLMLHATYCSLFFLTLIFDGVVMLTKYCSLDLEDIDDLCEFLCHVICLFLILLVFVTVTILLGYAPISWVRFGTDFEDWPGMPPMTLSSALLCTARLGKHIWQFVIPVLAYGIAGIVFVLTCCHLIATAREAERQVF